MRFSTYLLGVPAVVVAAAVAVANRQSVVFSLDPFSRAAPSALSFSAPLFLLLFAAVAAGVALGGVTAMWSRRGRRKRQEDAPFRRQGGKLRLPMPLRGSKPPEA